MNALKNMARRYILRTGRGRWFYRRFLVRSSAEWADYLRLWGGLHHCGEGVIINIGCNISDPYLVSIGNNVALSACTLLGHDAIVRVVNQERGLKLDSVGAIKILDNSFVGHGAIVMPNTTIGPNSVVAAGSVVSKDVPPGMVVGGAPAKVIGTYEEMVQRLTKRSDAYPWRELVEQRNADNWAEVEPRIKAMRKRHFFGDGTGQP